MPYKKLSDDRAGERSLATHDHAEVAGPGDRGIEQIALEHHVMLGMNRDHDRRILATLALVDRHRVGRHQLVQLAEVVSDGSSIKADGQF